MMSSRSILLGPLAALVIVALLPPGVVAAAEQKPLWLAVGKVDLVKPLEKLAEKRRGEGFEAVIATDTIEKALAAAPRRPDFLLLVGDDQPGKEAEAWYLAAKQRELYRWRQAQRREFASDATWGDLDGDLLPEVAVGRIPARTPTQVEIVVKKILAFERQQPTEADLQLPVWGGSPEYGAAIDAIASELLLGMIRANAPGWMQPWIISGNPHHPLCGWPPDQPALFSRQIRSGGVCGVLMGHAGAESFFSMSHVGQPIWYTARGAEAELAEGPPSAPLVFFSCESGDFARPTPCMAEDFLFFPGGPVATIGATTESHPLTNYFSGLHLLRELDGSETRLGTVWLAAQRKAMKARNFLVERVLRDVEGKLEENINVDHLRRDQMLMYALLGDPATRLRIPQPLRASVQRTPAGWRWTAERPAGATRLHVGYRSAAPRSAAQQQRPAQPKQARAAFEAANAALAFTALPSPPEQGPWEGTIQKPGWIRLVAAGGEQFHAAVIEAE